MAKRIKVGLALGSGSARGLAHIGVLKVLQEEGIDIDFIAGSSVGAMIGAGYALYGDVGPLLDIAYSRTKKPLDLMIDPSSPVKGIVSGKKIEYFLDEFGFKGKEFHDLRIPTIIAATDILKWTKVALIQGKVTKAIRASISIPGIFTPVKYGNTYLVDGGVTDPVPVDLLREAGVDFVIAVGLFSLSDVPTIWDIRDGDERSIANINNYGANTLYNFFLNLGKEKIISGLNWLKSGIVEGPNILDTIFTSINIMQKELSLRSLEEADIAIVPKGLKGFGLLDFDKAKELIEKGEEATWNLLPKIKKRINEKKKKSLFMS